MIDLWLPGLLVAAMELDYRDDMTVIETRTSGRGSTTLLRAKSEAWEKLTYEMEKTSAFGATTKSAAWKTAMQIRMAVNDSLMRRRP